MYIYIYVCVYIYIYKTNFKTKSLTARIVLNRHVLKKCNYFGVDNYVQLYIPKAMAVCTCNIQTKLCTTI